MIYEKLGIQNTIINDIFKHNYSKADAFIMDNYKKIYDIKLYDVLNYALSTEMLGASICKYSDIMIGDEVEL